MSEDVVPPADPAVASADPLADELAAILYGSAALSSRVPHLRKHLRVLHYRVQVLRAELDVLSARPCLDPAHKQRLLAQAEEIFRGVDRLTDAVRPMLP